MGAFTDVAAVAARVGTGLMGWRPADFWDATPAEFLAAVSGRFQDQGVVAPLLSADLPALLERAPDG
jgi:uncharacterized phage protein (TIGR02216 family)